MRKHTIFHIQGQVFSMIRLMRFAQERVSSLEKQIYSLVAIKDFETCPQKRH